MNSASEITLVKQKGAALILLVFMLALILTTYALRASSSNQSKLDKNLKTSLALEEAKLALLGWSVLQDNPGQLPCPENTALIGLANEGSALSTCVLPAIGRLPWRTLSLGDIRDGNGDKLWYVISDGFRNVPINSTTAAQLTLNGLPNSAVAIIFSAGPPIQNQLRPSSESNPAGISQYLEGENSNNDASFVSGVSTAIFNDKLIAVSKDELFDLVTIRVFREVRGDSTKGLIKFYLEQNKYPYADSLPTDGNADSSILTGRPSYQGAPDSLFFDSLTKSTLQNNGWFGLISYTITSDQQLVTLILNGHSLNISP